MAPRVPRHGPARGPDAGTTVRARPRARDRVRPAGIAPWPPLRHRLLAAPGLGRLVGTVAPGASRGRLRRQLGRGPVLHPERLSELMLDVIHAAATLPGARRAQRAMVRSATSWW